MKSFENADNKEIEKFDNVSAILSDLKVEMGTLHVINPLRTRFIMEKLAAPNPKILDVGCGGGILSEALAKAGARVTGLDLSEASLQAARQHAQGQGLQIDYRYESVQDVADREAGTFDAIACMEMLEHVPDPAQTIGACAQLARPGGLLVFSTINRNPKSYLFAVIGAEYVLRMLPRGTHDYARFIRPSELCRHARAAGLEAIDVIGMTYNPLLQRYRLEPDTSVNYMVACRKPGPQ